MFPRFSPILRGPRAAAGTPSIDFVNASAKSSASNSNNITITLPGSLVVGNLLVVWIATNNSFVISPPAGWTTFNGNSASDVCLFYRIITGTEGASANFTWSGTMSADGYAMQLQGTATSSVIGNHNTNVTSTVTASGASLTTGTNGSLVIAICIATAKHVDSASGTGWTDDNDATAVGVLYGYHTSRKLMAAAGAAGVPSFTLAAAATARVSCFEFKAA